MKNGEEHGIEEGRMNVSKDHDFFKILILKIDDDEIGVLADVIKNVVTTVTKNQKINYGINEKFAKMSNGIVQIENRFIIYLNADKLFDLKKEINV